VSVIKSRRPVEGEIDSEKREFVRKAAYSAPALIVLGLATHSRKASGQLPAPPSAPENQGVENPEEDDTLLRELGNRD